MTWQEENSGRELGMGQFIGPLCVAVTRHLEFVLLNSERTGFKGGIDQKLVPLDLNARSGIGSNRGKNETFPIALAG